MKDREKFIQRFDEIILETADDYKPGAADLKMVVDYFNTIITNWDKDLKNCGDSYEALADFYREERKKIHPPQMEYTDSLQSDAYGASYADKDRYKSFKNSNAFVFTAMLKALGFIIEYLEGLKGKPGETPKNNTKPILTAEQVALITIYKRIEVPEGAADSIAMLYGSGSGYNLYLKRGSLSNHADRTAVESKRKGRGKIARIESIMDYLSPDEQERAQDDVNIIQDKIDNL